MKISTKGRYGVRAMLELALNQGKGPLLLKMIAEKQQISQRYLERILNILVTTGLVKSVRGKRGGFYIEKDLNDITVYDIVLALEGSIAPCLCVEDKFSCNRSEICAARNVWVAVDHATRKVLQEYSLEKLVQMDQEKQSPKAHFYSI